MILTNASVSNIFRNLRIKLKQNANMCILYNITHKIPLYFIKVKIIFFYKSLAISESLMYNIIVDVRFMVKGCSVLPHCVRSGRWEFSPEYVRY